MINLNPDDLQVTSFAVGGGGGGEELAAAPTVAGVPCPYSCQICQDSRVNCPGTNNGCTSPGYNC